MGTTVGDKSKLECRGRGVKPPATDVKDEREGAALKSLRSNHQVCQLAPAR